ncbi:PKD domain-containing protein, partial [Candidatus Peregrinibacteria bacterium]|nr:PKD domain-containing protein [Candidatus Peregrinibacteria bacterium]
MQTFAHRFKIGLADILLATLVAGMIWPVSSVFAGDQMGPTAVLTVSPSAGSIYTVFDFDASKSTDSRGFSRNLEYRMNFDYSYEPFTDWGRRSDFEYQFTTSGDKTVILEVRDRDNGLTDRTIITVTVSSDLQFNAGLSVSPLKGDQNTSFQFDVQITTPIAIPASEYEVRYDFDGDNSWDTDFIAQRHTYYIYPAIGYYTPRIEVRDPDGNSIIVTGLEEDNTELGENREDMILVSRTGVPRASLDVYPNVGFSEKSTFYFDASDSFDYEDPAKLLYRFDFDNDGIFDTTFANEPYGQTTYLTPGNYTALVQVEDTDGLRDEAYTTLEVRSEDMAPSADFSISSDSPLSSDRTTGTLQTTFRFNASRSRDSEDRTTQLQVRWDFENDGTYDTPFSTTKDVQYRYLETGAYTVRLQVLDTAGHTASAIADVTVVANTAPTAHLSITPLAGTPATLFTIDPTSSNDAQYRTSQLQARYDFDSDGRYDTEFERVGRFRYNFSKAGNYTITMQIRDPEGQVALDTEKVEILENSAPVAVLTVSP